MTDRVASLANVLRSSLNEWEENGQKFQRFSSGGRDTATAMAEYILRNWKDPNAIPNSAAGDLPAPGASVPARDPHPPTPEVQAAADLAIEKVRAEFRRAPRNRAVGGVWYCKIGERSPISKGADYPMREAIAHAFEEITGHKPDFIFSGWSAELTEPERAVVEDRLPNE